MGEKARELLAGVETGAKRNPTLLVLSLATPARVEGDEPVGGGLSWAGPGGLYVCLYMA